jgi:hypothetical protein
MIRRNTCNRLYSDTFGTQKRNLLCNQHTYIQIRLIRVSIRTCACLVTLSVVHGITMKSDKKLSKNTCFQCPPDIRKRVPSLQGSQISSTCPTIKMTMYAPPVE